MHVSDQRVQTDSVAQWSRCQRSNKVIPQTAVAAQSIPLWNSKPDKRIGSAASPQIIPVNAKLIDRPPSIHAKSVTDKSRIVERAERAPNSDLCQRAPFITNFESHL